jgi:hypothetical protein
LAKNPLKIEESGSTIAHSTVKYSSMNYNMYSNYNINIF